MRQEAREAIAQCVNDLADALDPEYGEDALPHEEPHRERVEEARDRLALLLDRDGVEAETVERHDVGARARVKMTRGDGVRDQDEWVLEGSGASSQDAADELDELIQKYDEEWADEVRALDPWGEDPEGAAP